MIKIREITKTFGSVVALDRVSLEINPGECFALLGFNGAGKTTLINILTTVLSATSGSAEIAGFDLKRDRQEIRRIVNISPQEIAAAKNLTVRENMQLIASLYGIAHREQRIEQVLADFELCEKADVLVKRLSGGQMKRVSIALAVLTEPKILFLDEPTLGLDIKARARLWSTIRRLKGRMTILLTTHYLEEVEQLTDRAAVISRGRIKAVGTVEELCKMSGAKSLEEAFLQLSEEEE